MGYYFGVSQNKIRIAAGFAQTLLLNNRLKKNYMNRNDFRQYFNEYCELNGIKKIKIYWLLQSLVYLRYINHYSTEFIIFNQVAIDNNFLLDKYSTLEVPFIKNNSKLPTLNALNEQQSKIQVCSNDNLYFANTENIQYIAENSQQNTKNLSPEINNTKKKRKRSRKKKNKNQSTINADNLISKTPGTSTNLPPDQLPLSNVNDTTIKAKKKKSKKKKTKIENQSVDVSNLKEIKDSNSKLSSSVYPNILTNEIQIADIESLLNFINSNELPSSNVNNATRKTKKKKSKKKKTKNSSEETVPDLNSILPSSICLNEFEIEDITKSLLNITNFNELQPSNVNSTIIKAKKKKSKKKKSKTVNQSKENIPNTIKVKDLNPKLTSSLSSNILTNELQIKDIQKPLLTKNSNELQSSNVNNTTVKTKKKKSKKKKTKNPSKETVSDLKEITDLNSKSSSICPNVLTNELQIEDITKSLLNTNLNEIPLLNVNNTTIKTKKKKSKKKKSKTIAIETVPNKKEDNHKNSSLRKSISLDTIHINPISTNEKPGTNIGICKSLLNITNVNQSIIKTKQEKSKKKKNKNKDESVTIETVSNKIENNNFNLLATHPDSSNVNSDSNNEEITTSKQPDNTKEINFIPNNLEINTVYDKPLPSTSTNIVHNNLKSTVHKKQKDDLPTLNSQFKYISKEKCKLCNCSFKNKSQYLQHSLNEGHNLRYTYRTNKKELVSKNMDISINKLNANEGEKQLEILCDTHVKSQIVLTIANKTKIKYEISDILLLYTKLDTEITLAYQNLPMVITNKNHHSITINYCFEYDGVYMLPFIFKAINKSTNEPTYILKEVIFHVKSGFMDLSTIQKSVSYERKRYNTIFLDFSNLELINGVRPPASCNTGLQIVVLLGQYKLPLYIEKFLLNGLKVISRMSNREKEKTEQLIKLLSVRSPFNCLTKENYCDMLENLLYFEEHQMSIDIHEYDCVDQILNTVPGEENDMLLSLEVPGLAEERPSLIKGDFLIVAIPGDSFAYKGYIHAIQRTTVLLGFHNKFVTEVHKSSLRYNVTFGYNRHTIRTEQQAVDFIRKHKVQKYFFPNLPRNPNPLLPITFNWYQPKIADNEEQKQAVQHIVAGTSYPAPYLLFGPPGTGKTMTMVEAILQLWSRKPSCRILVAAPSNSAANEVTSRLVKHIPKNELFRMISVSFNYDTVQESIRPYCNHAHGEYFYPTIETLESYRVLIVTLSAAAKLVNGDIKLGHFTHVFIDESGHSTESEVLIPIAGIITHELKKEKLLGQIVLAGDPKQLGPIIRSKLAQKFGFGRSMLERLMTCSEIYKKNKIGKYNPDMVTKLVKNFRSHPAILKLPDEMFYDKELQAKGSPDAINIAIGWKCLPNPKFPIIFHNVLGQDEQEENSPSYFNEDEIKVVMCYLRRLIDKKLSNHLVKQEDIGIVSPYRKQVSKLQMNCRKNKWENILIGSVEQFQGQEKSIIIISTVRSRTDLVEHDYQYHLGFLRNPKRFNVAITRAKALVIVIGNANILQWDQHWGSFIEYCHDNAALTGETFQLKRSWLKLQRDEENDEFASVFHEKNNYLEEDDAY